MNYFSPLYVLPLRVNSDGNIVILQRNCVPRKRRGVSDRRFIWKASDYHGECLSLSCDIDYALSDASFNLQRLSANSRGAYSR